ncbi:Myb-like domain-containing protein [Entamoeba marina]
MEPQQNLNSYQTLASMFRSEMKEGVAPVWSYEESLLLEQQLARPDVTGDDLQIVLSIAPWFPHKSIQQISLRMRWVRLQTMQSWEDFCKTNDTRHRPNLSIQPDSPRENMSYSSNHSSNHSSPRKIDAATRRDSFRTTKSEEYLKQQKKIYW